MRRLPVATAMLAAATLVFAGCSTPAGVDGKIGDDWATLAEPVSFTPDAGVCHPTGFSETAYRTAYRPVDCGQTHQTETAYVGSFSGAAAERTSPPRAGSPELRAAFAECDRQARAYLGNDWRNGRLWLGVTLPSVPAWEGGARWYRCEVSELDDVENYGDTVSRTGSLKGALAKASALNLGCYNYVATADDGRFTAVACTKSHNAEFVGVHVAPNVPYPAKDSDWDRFHAACRRLVAAYAKVPDDGNLKYRTGTVLVPNGDVEWKNGNRGIRCYAWLSDRKLTRTLRGIGTKGLPINYA
jgi:Septum formation